MVDASGSPAIEPAVECHSYLVESPLTMEFDSFTGALTLESTTQCSAGDRGLVCLRLNFSPDAAHEFVRLLKAIEKEWGCAIGDQPQPLLRQ